MQTSPSLSTHPSRDTGRSCGLAIIVSAAMNTEGTYRFNVVTSFLSGAHPEARLLEHTAVLSLFFLRSYHSVFQRLHAFPPTVHSLSPYLRQPLWSTGLLMMATLTSVRWHLTVILICISLMMSDAEHFFLHLLAIVGHLWKNICWGPVSIFSSYLCYFAIEIY